MTKDKRDMIMRKRRKMSMSYLMAVCMAYGYTHGDMAFSILTGMIGIFYVAQASIIDTRLVAAR